jgi:HEPN domain-containing protein
MTKFNQSYALELLQIAQADLESAKVLAASWQQGRVENIFFLVQQAVEKALKSYLCFKVQEFPMVHDLGILLGKMDTLPPHGYNLVSFSQFAGMRRYETGKLQLDKSDIDVALKSGEEVLSWVATFVK